MLMIVGDVVLGVWVPAWFEGNRQERGEGPADST